MDRLSLAHSSHAAKSLGLDRHNMRTLSTAERVAMVQSKIDHHHDDDDGTDGPEGADSQAKERPAHTRDTMKTLSHVDRVAAVMQHLDDGISHEELGEIHGTTSVQGLSDDSHAFIKGDAPPPPSPLPGDRAGDGAAGDGAPRTTSVHAQNALDAHDSKMDAMKHLLLSVKMLREKPLLTSKLQEMGRILARKMDSNPATAAALEGGGIEDKLRGAFDGIMDEDHSGQLEYSEFKHGLAAIGLDLGDDVRELFEAIDTDDSGTVDVSEFIAAISAAKNVRASGPASQYAYESIPSPGFGAGQQSDQQTASRAAAEPEQLPAEGDFGKYDVDRDGLLNRVELSAFLEGQGFEVEEEYVTDLLTRYGGGPAGAGVSKEIFPHVWQHMFHTDEEGVRTVDLPIANRGFGFELVEGAQETGAILVSRVQPNSGAALAGVMDGDEAVMVADKILRNGGLAAALQYAQMEADLATEMQAARSKAGGRYRSLKDSPIRTQPSSSTGLTVSSLTVGANVTSRESAIDAATGVEWIHIDLGWAPTVSDEGEQLVIRTDGKEADSAPGVVQWKFGPNHSPSADDEAAGVAHSDEEHLLELTQLASECQRMLDDPSLSEADRAGLVAQMDDFHSQMESLGWTRPAADTGETEEQLHEIFEDHAIDNEQFLIAKELKMLLLFMGYSEEEVTAEYIIAVMLQYGNSEQMDFAGFKALYRELKGAPDDGAPEDAAGQAGGQQPAGQQLSEEEIFEKFNQWDTDQVHIHSSPITTRFPGRSLTVCLRSISVSVQDGLLYQPDIMALLIAEFNFPDDAGTDGVLDGAMDQFAQFDADANGSIDANEFIGLWYGLQRNPQRHSRDRPDRLLVFSLEIRNHFSGFPLESTLPPPALPSLNDQELAQKFDLYLLRHIFVKTLKENPFFRVSSSVIKRFRSAKKLNFRLLLFKYSRFLG